LRPGKPSGAPVVVELRVLTPEQIPDWLLVAKASVTLAWFALVFAGERLWPAAPRLPEIGLRRLGRNGALWFINTLLSPLIVLPVTAWAVGHSLGWRPDWWSGWPGVALDVVLLDFLIYWWHLANHRVPLLWRFHEVHHLDCFLDSTSAIRFHFGEVLLSAGARAGIILLLGFPFFSVLVFETLLLCATVFHHSNLRLPPAIERGLARVIITPSIHWVHHHAVRADTDSNYGTLFSFWDRLFRTRSPTARTPTMPIGVEGNAERALPQLLLRPFAGRN
jgi:sterol desaturase/sphingolipid hydroxylase (fatty acid hydroxylase superfamily)